MKDRKMKKRQHSKNKVCDFQSIAYLNKGFLIDADRFNLVSTEKDDKKNRHLFRAAGLVIEFTGKLLYQFCSIALLSIYFVVCFAMMFSRRMTKIFVTPKESSSVKFYSNKYNSGESLV